MPTNTSSLKRKTIDTNLGVISVQTKGKGPALVFWPSLMMSGSIWQEYADEFSSHYRVVLIDPPGHGESEVLHEHFSLEQCALCLSQIMDNLSIKRACLIGNSWGGMVGGTFAALYPEKTAGAVLINCVASS